MMLKKRFCPACGSEPLHWVYVTDCEQCGYDVCKHCGYASPLDEDAFICQSCLDAGYSWCIECGKIHRRAGFDLCGNCEIMTPEEVKEELRSIERKPRPRLIGISTRAAYMHGVMDLVEGAIERGAR